MCSTIKTFRKAQLNLNCCTHLCPLLGIAEKRESILRMTKCITKRNGLEEISCYDAFIRDLLLVEDYIKEQHD